MLIFKDIVGILWFEKEDNVFNIKLVVGIINLGLEFL